VSACPCSPAWFFLYMCMLLVCFRLQVKANEWMNEWMKQQKTRSQRQAGRRMRPTCYAHIRPHRRTSRKQRCRGPKPGAGVCRHAWEGVLKAGGKRCAFRCCRNEWIKRIGWTDWVQKGVSNSWGGSCMETARTESKISARNEYDRLAEKDDLRTREGR